MSILRYPLIEVSSKSAVIVQLSSSCKKLLTWRSVFDLNKGTSVFDMKKNKGA